MLDPSAKDFLNIHFSNFFRDKLYKELYNLIEASFAEDLGEIGDITSNAIFDQDESATAKIIAKQDGVFAGGFVLPLVFKSCDPTVKVVVKATEGERLTKKQVVATIFGPIKSILIGERTALNFISRISGISTLSRNYVDLVKEYGVTILDTRKTIPGWRYLDKYAVVVGGGSNHRIGLFDMVLIKENHITAAGGIDRAVNCCKKFLTSNKIEAKIEIETQNLNDVKQAIAAKVDRIMLDNMDLNMIEQAVRIVNKRIETEISGGINVDNLKKVAATGVDYISIGRLTHSVAGFDFSLLVE
ncbi:MAG: carboxylating nicotinate-nucleotide diphosphorylase [bacterium]|nr:carboxylating nicotinate-nucleotide diphosphorylase [bacterium]